VVFDDTQQVEVEHVRLERRADRLAFSLKWGWVQLSFLKGDFVEQGAQVEKDEQDSMDNSEGHNRVEHFLQRAMAFLNENFRP
jgi:hypothetical protein